MNEQTKHAGNQAKIMTFEQFKATRTACADLGEAIGADLDGVRSGYLYVGCLYIEKMKDGRFYLQIGNCERIESSIEPLERELYEFGCDEGYCGEVTP